MTLKRTDKLVRPALIHHGGTTHHRRHRARTVTRVRLTCGLPKGARPAGATATATSRWGNRSMHRYEKGQLLEQNWTHVNRTNPRLSESNGDRQSRDFEIDPIKCYPRTMNNAALVVLWRIDEIVVWLRDLLIKFYLRGRGRIGSGFGKPSKETSPPWSWLRFRLLYLVRAIRSFGFGIGGLRQGLALRSRPGTGFWDWHAPSRQVSDLPGA